MRIQEYEAKNRKTFERKQAEYRYQHPRKPCSKCGEVKSLKEFYKNGAMTKDGLTSTCKTCQSKQKKKYYQENRDHIKGEVERRIKGSPEARKAKMKYLRRYHREHKEEVNKKSREKYAKDREELADKYVLSLLRQGTNLKRDDIPEELVEAKRLQIQIERTLKGE